VKVYHGSDVHHGILLVGSFVSKRFKDACKFGYRKAVVAGASKVFIHIAEVASTELKRDANRDGAFILKSIASVEEIQEFLTYETPHKLTKFKMAEAHR